MAMQQEADPLIAKLSLSPLPDAAISRLPFRTYRGSHRGAELFLTVNGRDPVFGVDNIATQPATLATYIAITSQRPDLILNVGTAGGFSSAGACIGDVYLGTGEYQYHDRRIPLPGFLEYGRASIPALNVSALASALQLKTGIVSTGNSLDMTDRDLQLIVEGGATIKDMEATAIAWVARLFNIPFIAVKSITDLVDSGRPTAEEFQSHLALASSNLASTTLKIIDFCAGASLESLAAGGKS